MGAAADHVLTLSEPYLGASIIPTLTDTGITAAVGGIAASTLAINAPGTSIISNHVLNGAKLYCGGCSFRAEHSDTAATIKTATSLTISTGHDCHTDAVSSGDILYRRTDDPSNQNLYKSTDTAAATGALLTTRGSPDVYVLAHTTTETTVVTGYDTGTSVSTIAGALNAVTTGTTENWFVNGFGPYTATAGVATDDTDFTLDAASGGKATLDFNSATFTGAKMQVTATGPSSTVSAGDILALNGRRYKVKSSAGDVSGKFTLTENFAGVQLVQVCSACVSAVSVASVITTSQKVSVNKGDYVLVGGYVHDNLKIHVSEAQGTANDDVTVTGVGIRMGNCAAPHCPSGTATAVAPASNLALYKEINSNHYVGSKITETSQDVFQYVSQCSNRGTCDSATGVCKCFKGYSNDNCDNQNMLAM